MPPLISLMFPSLLLDANLDGIRYDIRSFDHQDQANPGILEMSCCQLAVDSIPAGQTLPVIVVDADSCTGMDLKDLSSSYVIDGPLSFDLTGEPSDRFEGAQVELVRGGLRYSLELHQVIGRGSHLGHERLVAETAVGLISAMVLWRASHHIGRRRRHRPPTSPR